MTHTQNISRPDSATKQHAKLTESKLQRAWAALKSGEKLRTVDGAELEVRCPGVRNREAGPDFRNACFTIGGAKYSGDVEMHIRPAGWAEHGHDASPEYNHVLLHVVLSNSGPLDKSGAALLAVAPDWMLSRTLRPASKPASSGDCARIFHKMDDIQLRRFFESMGLQRFLATSAVSSTRIAAEGVEATFGHALFRAMGYKKNKNQFEELWMRMSEHGGLAAKDFEAALWGESGLLPEPSDPTFEPESKEITTELWTRWWKLRREDRPPIPWLAASVRPANSPPRRIAALAALRNKHGDSLFQSIAASLFQRPGEKFNWRRQIARLTVSDPFWNHHKDFGAQLRTPMAILGPSRLLDILVNGFLPCLHAQATLSGDGAIAKDCLDALATLPSTQDNFVTEVAAARWMIPLDRGRRIFHGALAGQGCVAAYKEFCNACSGDCAECGMWIAAKEHGRRQPPTPAADKSSIDCKPDINP